jgi:hypothetical protein
VQEKEKGEEGGKEGEEECTSCKNDQEVVFIQDLGFTVKVAAPGVEPFDIQVSSLENGAAQVFEAPLVSLRIRGSSI